MLASSLCVFAFALLPLTARADTVLGGIVDYNPKCYKGPKALMFIEYNSGACFERDFYQACECDIASTDNRRQQLTDTGNGCVFVSKTDFYKINDPPSILNLTFDDFNANRTSTSYYSGIYNSKSDNAPVSLALDLAKNASHVGLSLWKGIKMVRFQFLQDGQRQDWFQGVQIRFTNDFKQRMSARDLGDVDIVQFNPANGMVNRKHDLVIDLQCFYITSIIPFFRREKDHHLIDCMKFIKSHTFDPPKDIPTGDLTSNVADIINCEEGTNFQNIITPDGDITSVLVGFFRNLAIAGVSFIPVAGPFLAVGLDVAIDLAEGANGEKFVSKVLGDAGYDVGAIEAGKVVKQIADILSKRVRRLR